MEELVFRILQYPFYLLLLQPLTLGKVKISNNVLK